MFHLTDHRIRWAVLGMLCFGISVAILTLWHDSNTKSLEANNNTENVPQTKNQDGVSESKSSITAPNAISEIETVASKSTVQKAFIESGDLSYSRFKANFDKSSLPFLFAALNDDAYRPYWSNIVMLISFLGESEQSSNKILKHLNQSENWNSALLGKMTGFYTDKANSILWLGLTKGSSAEAFLSEVATGQGAGDLVEKWKGSATTAPWDWHDEFLVATVRGSAIEALFLIDKARFMSRFDAAVAEIESRTNLGDANISESEVSPEMDIAMTADFYLNSHLVQAVAYQKILDNEGLDKFQSLFFDSSERVDHVTRTIFSP